VKVKVIGVKRFEGTVDGKSIKSGKLYVEVKLDDSRNSATQFAKGMASEELRVDQEVIKRIEHLSTPFMAEVDTERVSNGREAKEVVIDVRPIDLVKKVAA
jgi:hypothetical protein